MYAVTVQFKSGEVFQEYFTEKCSANNSANLRRFNNQIRLVTVIFVD